MSGLLRLRGHATQLAGALTVRRLLPAVAKRSVGPFVFFDHFGPVTLPPDAHTDVGGHPHIGLATVTYLFEGRMVHRDSLGTVQTIEPGAINWMSAGKGIVHSERMAESDRGLPRALHGLQLWVALPKDQAEGEPSFQHAAAESLPTCVLDGGVRVRLLVGEAFGLASPVVTASPTLYLDIEMPPGAAWVLPPLATEQAIYLVSDALGVDGESCPAHELIALPPGQDVVLCAPAEGARLVLIGGAPLAQPVRMWWNFVSVDPARIEQAAALWAAGGFDPVPGELDRIAAPAWRPMREAR